MIIDAAKILPSEETPIDIPPAVEKGERVLIKRNKGRIAGTVIHVTEHIFTVRGDHFVESFRHADVLAGQIILKRI